MLFQKHRKSTGNGEARGQCFFVVVRRVLYLGAPLQPKLENVIVTSTLNDLIASVVPHVVQLVRHKQILRGHLVTADQKALQNGNSSRFQNRGETRVRFSDNGAFPELFRVISDWQALNEEEEDEEEGESVRVDTTFQHMRTGRGTQDIEFTKWWTRTTPALCRITEYHCWTPLFGIIVFSSGTFLFHIRQFLHDGCCNARDTHVLLKIKKRRDSLRLNFRCLFFFLLLLFAPQRMDICSIARSSVRWQGINLFTSARKVIYIVCLLICASALSVTMRLSMLTKRTLYTALQRQQQRGADKSARSPPEISRQPVHGILISEGEVRS